MSCLEFTTFVIHASKLTGNDLVQYTKQASHLLPFFVRLFHPLKTTGIGKKWLERYEALKKKKYHTVVKPYKDPLLLFDDLSERNITGDVAIWSVGTFIELYDPNQLVLNSPLYMFFTKSPKLGISMKIANKAFPNLLPTFGVVLAKEYDSKKIDGNWFISRKIDGIRCICKIEKNFVVRFFSRTAREFHSLSILEKEIRNRWEKNDDIRSLLPLYLDGEVISYDDSFQNTIKQITKKTTMKSPIYYIWDMLTTLEFEYEKGEVYSSRYQRLSTFLPTHSNQIKRLEQIPYNKESWEDMERRMMEEKWEGLMLRNDTLYEGKRTKNLLKYKKFFDNEFEIVDVNYDLLNVAVAGKGREDKMMLKNIVIHYPASDGKIYRVDVGSGFSYQERMTMKKENLIGNFATVRYFEETRDQHGNFSLRFPTKIAIYSNKRDL